MEEIVCFRCGASWSYFYVRFDVSGEFEREGAELLRCPDCPPRRSVRTVVDCDPPDGDAMPLCKPGTLIGTPDDSEK